MNDQLERDLLASFNRRAEAPVDTSALAVAAARRGRRLRARVYTARGLGVVALAAAGVLGVAAVRPNAGEQTVGEPLPTPVPSASNSAPIDAERPPPGGWRVPGLPIATGVPGAAAAPRQVGTDPAVLHFTVGDWTVDSPSTTWSSRDGAESIAFQRDAAYYQVGLARNQAQLDALRDEHNVDTAAWPKPDRQSTVIGGKPATLYVYGSGPSRGVFYLRWQPIDGVWAQVYGHGTGSGAGDATQIAAKLRLDTAYRCVAPVRLTSVPAGAKLLGCSLTLTGADLADDKGNPTRLSESLLTVGAGANGAEVAVRRLMPNATNMTITIAGHPAGQFTNEREQPSIDVPDFDGVTVQLAGRGTYNAQTLIGIAEGITVSGDGRDPATWPERIVG